MYVRTILTITVIFGLTGVAIAQGSCGGSNPNISCPAGQIWDSAAGQCAQLTVIG